MTFFNSLHFGLAPEYNNANVSGKHEMSNSVYLTHWISFDDDSQDIEAVKFDIETPCL